MPHVKYDKDVAKQATGSDWREKLRNFLLQAGTDGRKQKDIVFYLQEVVTAAEITQHMTAWKAEGKVDRYTVPTGGRPATIWRATTKMLEEVN